MANISNNWNKNMPSGTSLISEGDDLMRQHWTSLQSTLVDEHYFSDSATSAGIHKPGSARVFYAPASQNSAPGTVTDKGRLYLESDTATLYQAGETVTRVGSAGVLLTTSTDGPDIICGSTSDHDQGVFAEITQEWGVASGDTWGVESGGSIKRVRVPSNLSGYFAIRHDAQFSNGIRLDSSGADQIFWNVIKNGISVYTSRVGPPTSQQSIHVVGFNYILAAKSDDTIHVRLWHDNNPTTAEKTGLNQLSIYKVG